MESVAVVGGLAAIAMGLYSMLYPEGRHVRNWVSPKKWQDDPDAAAREQAEWAGWMGALVFLFGCALVLVGLLG
jgi:hypothetical protein